MDSVTEAVSVDLTSTVGDWAMTVTSSLTVAGFIWMSSVRVAVVFTRIFSRTTVPKPWQLGPDLVLAGRQGREAELAVGVGDEGPRRP